MERVEEKGVNCCASSWAAKGWKGLHMSSKGCGTIFRALWRWSFGETICESWLWEFPQCAKSRKPWLQWLQLIVGPLTKFKMSFLFSLQFENPLFGCNCGKLLDVFYSMVYPNHGKKVKKNFIFLCKVFRWINSVMWFLPKCMFKLAFTVIPFTQYLR